MKRARRLLPVLLVWWAFLFWLWLLLVGEWNAQQWAAAGVAGLVAATAAVVVHALGMLRFRVRASWLAPVPSVLVAVPVDFALLVRALVRTIVRRKATRGVFRARPVDAGRPGGPVSTGRRGLLGVLATYSPNAYVVDIDPERQVALLHDLVPRRSSERPL